MSSELVSEDIWDYFTISADKSTADCKKCGKTIKTTKGNNTGLYCHQQSIHKIEVSRKLNSKVIQSRTTSKFRTILSNFNNCFATDTRTYLCRYKEITTENY